MAIHWIYCAIQEHPIVHVGQGLRWQGKATCSVLHWISHVKTQTHHTFPLNDNLQNCFEGNCIWCHFTEDLHLDNIHKNHCSLMRLSCSQQIYVLMSLTSLGLTLMNLSHLPVGVTKRDCERAERNLILEKWFNKELEEQGEVYQTDKGNLFQT